jgi:transposase-like protein
MTKRQRFSKEFKLEAVRLLESGDKNASDLATELGVRRNQLYKWREEFQKKGDAAFQGAGRRSADKDDHVTKLEKENARLKEELEILKKAAVYFAKELK